MEYVPSDGTASCVVIDNNGSCAMYNITSPAFAGVFGAFPKIGDPSGVVGVELSYTDSNDNIVYNPNNIQSTNVIVGPTNPSDNC